MKVAAAPISDPQSEPTSLTWSGKVLCEEDVRRHLNGHRRVILTDSTIVTPLAAEAIKSLSLEVVREAQKSAPPFPSKAWGVAQEFPEAIVTSALHALTREGLHFVQLPATGDDPDLWPVHLAGRIFRQEVIGTFVFCADPSFICCLANKLPRIRAASVHSIASVTRAITNFSPNFVAIDRLGRTYYEIRQMVQLVCQSTRVVSSRLEHVLSSLEQLDENWRSDRHNDA